MNWKNAYFSLKNYVLQFPEVKLGEVIDIPAERRAEFYQRFDEVRELFVKQSLGQSLISKADKLREEFVKLENEIVKQYSIQHSNLETNMNKFINNPIQMLTESLFSPLFDVLKGRLEITTFQNTQTPLVISKFYKLYHSGYKNWIALALLKAFNADTMGRFTLHYIDPYRHQHMPAIEYKPRFFRIKKLDLSFRSEPYITADFVAYNHTLGLFMAIKSNLTTRALAQFNFQEQSSSRRKWIPLNPDLDIFAPENIFIYVTDSAESISLIVNNYLGVYKQLCCPDILIRYSPVSSWYTERNLNNTCKLNDHLVPHKCIIAHEKYVKPKWEVQNIPFNNIDVLNINFDQSIIQCLVTNLTQTLKLPR